MCLSAETSTPNTSSASLNAKALWHDASVRSFDLSLTGGLKLGRIANHYTYESSHLIEEF